MMMTQARSRAFACLFCSYTLCAFDGLVVGIVEELHWASGLRRVHLMLDVHNEGVPGRLAGILKGVVLSRNMLVLSRAFRVVCLPYLGKDVSFLVAIETMVFTHGGGVRSRFGSYGLSDIRSYGD